MTNILITGALGSIGYVLSKTLQKKNLNIHLLDNIHSNEKNYFRCDIFHYSQLSKIFEEIKFDTVFHFAGEFGRWNGEDFYENMWKTNVIGTKNLIRLQEKYKFKIIFASSSEVYGDYNDVMTEDVVTTKFIRPMNDYATSKLVNEIQILNSKDMFNTQTTRIRIFNTYGPGEYFNDYRSVICRFVYSAIHNKNYKVFLNHSRTSTFISDMVNGIICAYENFSPGEVFNLAGEDYHTIKEVSDMILFKMNLKDDIVEYLEAENFTTMNKKTSNIKAKKNLNFNPQVTLEEGIDKTIKWMKDVYLNNNYNKNDILNYLK
jgi:dTDP-glucose 4,6-dehydratase